METWRESGKRIINNLPQLFVISFLLAVMTVFIANKCSRTQDEEVKETVKVEIKTVHDTITVREPHYIDKRVTDTIYITYRDTVIFLPREQKHYADTEYEAWVSGFEPKLDSLRVCKRIDSVFITRDIERKIYERKWGFVPYVGCDYVNSTFVPKVGFNVETKGNFTFGASIGLYEKQPMGGLTIGYRITKNKK